MAAPTQAQPPPPVSERGPRLGWSHPAVNAALRWAFIAATSLWAFHRSLDNLIDVTRQGSLNGYVWMVAAAALLAAAGLALHHRTELPIHDRQTDIIVAIMGLVLALLLHGVLLGRYALYFQLLRLDLVAWWVFVVSASIALFGLRPVIRFSWAWLLLLAVCPLPYHLFVLALGGTKIAAGMGTLLVAAVATAIAVGWQSGWGLIGALTSWIAGLVVLAVLAVLFPDASMLTYQLVPSLTSIVVAAGSMLLLARRDGAFRVLDRKVKPLAAAQVWSAVPLVAGVAVALSLVRLPDAGVPPPVRIDTPQFNTSLNAPDGWHVAETRTYPWVARLYGEGSELVRQEMVSDQGDPRFDKLSRPRALVVDTITTPRPSSLPLFPARMPYRVKGVRISDPQEVDLGSGVTGTMFTAVDDEILVTWDAIGWTWTNGSVAQRILVISVDNHDDDAPFPQPTGGVARTVNSLFNILFRGNAATSDLNPIIKDDVLLTEFGRGLVSAQLAPLGATP